VIFVPAPTTTRAPAMKTILIVDDEPLMNLFLQQYVGEAAAQPIPSQIRTATMATKNAMARYSRTKKAMAPS
jgi:hypothetical protein